MFFFFNRYMSGNQSFFAIVICQVINHVFFNCYMSGNQSCFFSFNCYMSGNQSFFYCYMSGNQSVFFNCYMSVISYYVVLLVITSYIRL